mgnify:CR=1 FL=1
MNEFPHLHEQHDGLLVHQLLQPRLQAACAGAGGGRASAAAARKCRLEADNQAGHGPRPPAAHHEPCVKSRNAWQRGGRRSPAGSTLAGCAAAGASAAGCVAPPPPPPPTSAANLVVRVGASAPSKLSTTCREHPRWREPREHHKRTPTFHNAASCQQSVVPAQQRNACMLAQTVRPCFPPTFPSRKNRK